MKKDDLIFALRFTTGLRPDHAAGKLTDPERAAVILAITLEDLCKADPEKLVTKIAALRLASNWRPKESRR